MTDIENSRSEALKRDEYRIADIIGMRVINVDGTPIGTVTDVMHTRANDVYTIDTGEGEVLIPATKEVIKNVSVKKKEMTIEPLEGLF